MLVRVLLSMLAVIAGLVLAALGALIARDVARAARFAWGARRLAPSPGDGDDASRGPGKKLTPEEADALRRALWAQLYRPGLSRPKLEALRALREQQVFFLDEWLWRLWWRGWFRLSREATGEFQEEAQGLARVEAEAHFYRLCPADLDAYLSLMGERDAASRGLSWARHHLTGWRWRRQALGRLEALAGGAGSVGEEAFVALMSFLVERRDEERAVELFARLRSVHPAAAASLVVPGLLDLGAPALKLFSLPLGSRRLALFRRARGASFRLTPLRFAPSPGAARGWLQAPPGPAAGQPAGEPLGGPLDLIALPFSFGAALLTLPALRGTFSLEVRATPEPSPSWSKRLPDLELPDAEHREFLQENSLDAVLSLTEQGASLWVLDREKKAPAADLPVTFWLADAGGGLVERPRRTGPDGLVTLPDAKFWQLGASVSRPGSHGADEFLFLTHAHDIVTAASVAPEDRLYLWLARPLYRPGETVQGKLVARSRGARGPSARWPAGRGVALDVRGPRGNTIASLSLSLSSFGTASFSLVLPAGAPLGRYTFVPRHAQARLRVEGSFQVEEFVAPEFRATLAALGSPRWGEALPLQFSASYFFGGPVAGASGTVEIRRRGWSYRGSSQWPPARRMGDEKTLEPLTFQTDAAGQASLTLPWLGPLDLLRRLDGCDLELKATMRDASGKTCEAALTLSFARLSQLVEVTPGQILRLPGEPLPLGLRWSPGPAGDPVVHDLTLTLRRGLTTHRRTVRVSTADREVSLPLGLPPGAWSLTATLAGQRRPLQPPREVWILGEQLDAAHPRLLVSRSELGPGEAARVAFVRPPGSPPLSVLLVYNRGEALRSRVLSSQGNAAWADIAPPPGAASRVHLQAWFVLPHGGFQLDSRYDALTVPAASDEPAPAAGLSLAFAAATARPGSAITLEASPHDGAPSELLCSVVDEAIFSLVPAPRSPVDFFEEPPPPQADAKAAWGATWAGAQAGRPALRPLDAPSFARGALAGELFKSAPGAGAPVSLAAPAMAPMAQSAPSAPSLSLDEADMAAAPARRSVSMANLAGMRMKKADQGGGGPEAGGFETEAEPPPPPAALRSDFSSEAAWYPGVAIAGGVVALAVRLPDALTTWKASALRISLDERLGEAEARVKTQKPLMVRLQAPRFFQERDTFPLRALVDSRADEELQVRASLEAPGLTLRSASTFELDLAAGGQRKIEAEALVPAGDFFEIVLRARAQGPGGEGDEEERRVPFRSYGVLRRQTAQGVLSGDAESVVLTLPGQRKREKTRLTLKIDRGPLDAVLHALDYLREYPYGCTEQTCSRLIPHLVWQRVTGAAGGPSPGYREAGADPVPGGAVEEGLKRLLSSQNADGGFGWWPSRGSDVWMTSYVLFSFSIGGQPDEASLQRASRFLRASLLDARNPDDADAFAAFALAWRGEAVDDRVFQVLLPRWGGLSLTEQAKLCLPLRAARHPEAPARAASVLRKLVRAAKKFLKQLADGEGAEGAWFEPRATEAIAFFLLVLLRDPPSKKGDPGHDALDPDGEALGLLASFLLLHRTGARWHSTRDTALAVLALLACEERTGQGAREILFRATLGGKELLAQATGASSRQALALSVGDDAMETGENRLILSTEGLTGGALQHRHYTVELAYCTQQDEIPPVAEGLRVERVYWLLDGKGKRSRRLASGDRVAVGQRVQVAFSLKADQPRRYLLLEDPKLAGCEPLAKKSGPEVCEGRCEHVELRADRTAIFVASLGDRAEELSYEIEAQIPGEFTALPATLETMYDSQCQGASGSFSLTIDP